jgi:dihydrofolate synthase / folylpolyglutamate synthase
MLANKDPAAIIAPLQDRLASITVVPVPGHEHHDAAAFGLGCHAAENIEDALASLSIDPANETVLIAGSLYLAGEVLKANRQEPD